VPGVVALIAALSFLLLPSIVERHERTLDAHPRWGATLRTTAEGVRGAKRTLSSTEWLTIGAWAYLLCDIAVLWLCLHALGQSPPFASVILAYQIGYITNIIPVPGGIGVLDAGLVAMLVLCGIPATPATGAVLAYHAISLWVPVLIGTLAFVLLRRSIASGRDEKRYAGG
jgi:uncharacterized protein (TIRG00374 family)